MFEWWDFDRSAVSTQMYRKQSKAEVSNSRERTSDVRRCGRSKEGKLGEGQAEPEGSRPAGSRERKTFHWRMPQAKGHQSPRGGLSKHPEHSPCEDGHIPQLLSLGIKLHDFETGFQSVQSLEARINRNPTRDWSALGRGAPGLWNPNLWANNNYRRMGLGS